LPNKDFGV
jgi:hypothetical protein